MISSIGFIPNSSEITTLNEFDIDEAIRNKLEYLSIPILPKEPNEDIEEFPEIKATDKILFCTPNTEEISNLAFYGYDNTEMFFHHDLFVFSTILDSCFVKESYVAVATFEPTIFIYDALVNFPILPQILLEGHEGPVTGIKNKENKLISCSNDKTIIEWDINTFVPKTKTNLEVAIDKFDYEGSSLVFGTKNYLNINNENIVFDHEIEQLKIKENNVFVSDCVGNLFVFDIRAPATPMLTNKAHDDAIIDICLVKDWIATTSLDNHIKLWKLEANLVCKNDIEHDSTVYALGYNEFDSENEIFAGNGENFIYPIKLEEKIE